MSRKVHAVHDQGVHALSLGRVRLHGVVESVGPLGVGVGDEHGVEHAETAVLEPGPAVVGVQVEEGEHEEQRDDADDDAAGREVGEPRAHARLLRLAQDLVVFSLRGDVVEERVGLLGLQRRLGVGVLAGGAPVIDAVPGFVQLEDPEQANHAEDPAEARAHARGATRARDRAGGPAVQRGRRHAATADLDRLGAYTGEIGVFEQRPVRAHEEIGVVVALGETRRRHELGYVDEEGHGGHRVEPEEEAEGVIALRDARENHLQTEEKEAHVHDVHEDPVVFLRERQQPDVVAEEGPQRDRGHEEGDARTVDERGDPAFVHRRRVGVEGDELRVHRGLPRREAAPVGQWPVGDHLGHEGPAPGETVGEGCPRRDASRHGGALLPGFHVAVRGKDGHDHLAGAGTRIAGVQPARISRGTPAGRYASAGAATDGRALHRPGPDLLIDALTRRLERSPGHRVRLRRRRATRSGVTSGPN